MLLALGSKLSVYLWGALQGLRICCHSHIHVFSMIGVIRVGKLCVHCCPLSSYFFELKLLAWKEDKFICSINNAIAYIMQTLHQDLKLSRLIIQQKNIQYSQNHILTLDEEINLNNRLCHMQPTFKCLFVIQTLGLWTFSITSHVWVSKLKFQQE